MKKIFLLLFFALLLTILTLKVTANTPPVTWSTPRVVLDVYPCYRDSFSLSFNSTQRFENVTVWIVPELRPFISVFPEKFPVIEPDIDYDVLFFVHIPCDTKPGHYTEPDYPDYYNGTVHIKEGNATRPRTLKVEIYVREGPVAPM